VYQTGETIKSTIEQVQRHEYVLPAIQREFVWKPEQIQRLFDSLMQGYPFGTFLLWRVNEENSEQYRFYDFVRDYHERDNPHCPQLPVQTKSVTAVLDGQQRLTALNIGLCGSMALKQPKKWWNNPNAFPVRRLYLDLLTTADPDEDGDRYRFDFLTDEQAAKTSDGSACWFRVGDILTMKGGPEMVKWLNARLPQEHVDAAYETIDRLHRVINSEKVIAYYEEKSQDLSTVLNIFIRTNSGGTVLSYSDLLLSIAVAQWENLDARQEIHVLVDKINRAGDGFAFSQDLVLKAGLLLADINSIGFKVENFNRENMAALERQWVEVRTALDLTVRLIASFGFNGQNLRAASAILPIAYYLHRLAPGEKYLTSTKYSDDRERIRIWLIKSLLKASGIWGSGLDTLLVLLRDTIREHGGEGFPIAEIEVQMARRGKGLAFESEEIAELVDLRYGEPRTFALLTLLFPFIDLRNHFHVDHIFPQAQFKRSKLRKVGLSEDEIDRFQDLRDGLANLQLLEGAINVEKQQTMPFDWLSGVFQDNVRREQYGTQHLLGDVPESIEGFPVFYEARRKALVQRITELLGKVSQQTTETVDDSIS